MNFFNIDLHISVIADMKNIFEGFGHTVTDESLSGHTWVFNRLPNYNRVVSQRNWQSINENMCSNFYREYKDELSIYDAFIVTYPPCFSLLYEKFNKPIIVNAPIRLEFPLDSKQLSWLIDFLKNGIDNKQIIPVANNKYDKMNCERLTNREWIHIPNICDYTGLKYKANAGKFLVYTKRDNIKSNYCIRKESVFPTRYKWEDLNKFKGIVHMPYNVSTMSIFEQYTANFPLIFPSLDFAYDNWGKLRLFSEIGTVKNNCTRENLSLSDFYDDNNMPYISYFDENNSLDTVIEKIDVKDISEKMNTFNIGKRKNIENKWQKILEKIND